MADLRKIFLSHYEGSNFVVQQRASVLLWIQLLLLPIIFIFIIINLLRLKQGPMVAMITIDMVFALSMVTGIWLIKTGRYSISVLLNTICVTTLTVIGHLIRLPSQITTGSNSFSYLIFGVIVFVGMFGTRRTLVAVFALFTALTTGIFLYLMDHSSNELFFINTANTMNLYITMIVVFALSWLSNKITDTAMSITEAKIEKNKQLNKQLERKIEKKSDALRVSVEQNILLKGLLPICASCKKVRDDQGYWNQIEEYVSARSEADFSHSICPDCYKVLYGNLEDDD